MEVPVQLQPIILGTLLLCGVLYLCQFENCLEYISLSIFDLIIHFDSGGGKRRQVCKKLPIEALP